MTFDETIEIMRIVKAEWPHSFRDMSKKDGEARLNLWATMFADDDAGLVGAAVKSLIVAGNREFAPGVGQIKEQMRKLIAGNEHTEADAWNRVRKAIRNSAYEYEAEFGKLPPILQKLVGSPSQLHEWALMDSNELGTVVRAYIERGYRTMKQREEEAAKLPSDVRQMLGGIFGGYRLEAQNGH